MPIENPYYSEAVHGPFELVDIGDLVLERRSSTRSSATRATPRGPTPTPPTSRAACVRHAGLFALHVLSNDFWTEEHWAALGFSSAEDFRIGFLEGYFGPMDAADLVCQAWKWRHGDVSRHTGGDLAAALGRITAKTFVLPISSDKFFPPRRLRRRAGPHPGQRAARDRGRARPRVAVRPRRGLRQAGGWGALGPAQHVRLISGRPA